MASETLHAEHIALNFIRDDASKEDDFGPHQRLADAIAEVIRNNKNLNVIGLLGPWGSGKSTVIKLVESNLHPEDGVHQSHCVFTYDAWLHQSDPPRRAFLESLVTFLDANDLADEKIWREDLDRLNGKIEDTITTNTPALTPAGRAIFISLFLVPIGAVFAGHEWYHDFQSAPWISWTAALYIVSVVAIASPLIVAAFLYLKWRPTWNCFRSTFWKGKNWTQHKSGRQEESILSLFMNRQITKNKSRVLRDPEPTAIEFQNIFQKIMGAVGQDAKKRQLVFVIDNLDRLPAQDALAMWATIRSFFLGSQKHLVGQATSITPVILLPIDESAIASMFKGEPEPTAAIAASFIAKTFDLTFRVTKPILSSWDTYLDKQMAKVFGHAYQEGWSGLAARFYHYFESSIPGFKVTPRSVNRLVNDIATMWLQWRGEAGISFPSIAYYCVFREAIDEKFLTEVASPKAGIDELDNDWARSIAALHYGVMPSEAEQILIEQPLRTAIQTGSQTEFNRLTKIPGFVQTLLRVVSKWREDKSNDPQRVFEAATLIYGSPLSPTATIKHIWKTLRRVLQETGAWKSFSKSQCDALQLLAHSSPSAERKEFLQYVANTFAGIEPTAASEATFVAEFDRFWQEAALNSDAATLPQHILVPGGAVNFLQANTLLASEPQLRMRLRTSCEPSQLVSAIADEINATNDASKTVERFRHVRELIKGADLKPLVERLGTLLRSGAMDGQPIVAAAEVLGYLRKDHEAVLALSNSLCADNQIANRLPNAIAQNNDELTAALLAIQIFSGLPFDLPDPPSWIQRFETRPNLLNLVNSNLTAYALEEHGVITPLFTAVQKTPSLKPIAKALFTHRISHPPLGRLPVRGILTNLDGYLELIAPEVHQRFLVNLSGYQSFWETMATLPLKGDVSTVIKALIVDSGQVGDTARQWIQKVLSEVGGEQWIVAIRDGSSPYDVLQALFTTMGAHATFSVLWEPLNSGISTLLATNDQAFRTRWFNCTLALPTSERQTLYGNVRDKINSGHDIADIAQLLNTSGTTFLEQGEFLDSADSSVRHIVYPLLGEGDWNIILLKFAPIFCKWIEQSKEHTSEHLRNQIETKADSSPGLEERIVDNLLKELGLPGRRPKYGPEGAGPTT